MAEMTQYAHGQFSWVDLMSADIDEAKAFYAKLFGWDAVDQDTQGGPPYVIFEQDGKHVAGMGALTDEMRANGVPPCWNSYVNVDDVNEIVGRVEEFGGKVTMPPMQVLQAGHMAGFQDPTGAFLFVWQKLEHIGARVVNEPGTLCWNELATTDVERAREFFGALFDWDFAEHDGTPTKYYITKVDGRENGGLMQMNDEWEGIPPCWCVYFAVADVEATVAKVTELGGGVNVPPFDIPVGRMSVVADPHGAVFSVIQLADPPE